MQTQSHPLLLLTHALRHLRQLQSGATRALAAVTEEPCHRCCLLLCSLQHLLLQACRHLAQLLLQDVVLLPHFPLQLQRTLTLCVSYLACCLLLLLQPCLCCRPCLCRRHLLLPQAPHLPLQQLMQLARLPSAHRHSAAAAAGLARC
jgi:hypothetical protein